MAVDRGDLSRIDRKLLAGLGADDEWRMVRIPASEALWSAWKRYCSAIGISMGRALAALVERELETVIGIKTDDALLASVEVRLRNQDEELAEREKRLAERELSIVKREQSLERMVRLASRSSRHDVGRNERCPCGSGAKYKRCHGRFV